MTITHLLTATCLFIHCASGSTSSPTPTPSPSIKTTSEPAKDYRLDEVIPTAKPSYYTNRILKFLDPWPPATLTIKDPRPVLVRAIQTPDAKNYIGMVKHFTVAASLPKVIQLTEDFEAYPKIWENILEVKVLSRDRNRTLIEFTRKRPAFFLPKIQYKMMYVSDKSNPNRIVYRQQFVEGNTINFSDALVVIEKLTDSQTRLSIINFFDANFGPLKAIAEGAIWKKSMENSFKDDVAFTARLLHPDYDLDEITEAAEKSLDRYPINDVEYTDLLKW